MTKKSPARIMRDATQQEANGGKNKKNEAISNVWNDLQATRMGCVELLAGHATTVRAVSTPELIAHVADQTGLASAIRSLSRDLIEFNNMLRILGEKHIHLKGSAKTPDEGMIAINIYEAYQAWMTQHDAVVMPTVYTILEHLDQAQRSIQAAHDALQATNVNVVTDVEAKVVEPQDFHPSPATQQ